MGLGASRELLKATASSWPCDPLWRTDRGLDTAGPRAFGYDLDYVPVEDLTDG